MDNEVITTEQQSKPALQSQINPMQLMQVAVESNADLDKLERLMALQERWEAGNARKAYYKSMANFQRNCPNIIKMKDGHNCKYAPLGDIIAQIKDLLADCGLSIRFEQDFTNGISVSCVVTHEMGHSERTTMSAPADGSGSKNAIQAIASTNSYLQRYTLIGALGITTADADMDGRLPEDNRMTPNADKKIIEILTSQGRSEPEFFSWASKVLKKAVSSFDDLTEEQIQWFLRKLEGRK